MKLFLSNVMFLSLFCIFASTVRADEASKRAKIREYFELVHMDKTVNQLADQQTEQARKALPSMFPNLNLSTDQQKAFDAFIDRVTAISRETVNWSKLEPEFVEIYASTYPEEDIDGILAFYKSPVGRDLLSTQPTVLSRSQAITQKRLAEMQPTMRAASRNTCSTCWQHLHQSQ